MNVWQAVWQALFQRELLRGKPLKRLGGEYESRTHLHGFAIRCVTAPPTRRSQGSCNPCHFVAQAGLLICDVLLWIVFCGKTNLTKLNEWVYIMSDYAKRRKMMVDAQVRPQDVTKFPIIDAMLKVPRESYVPDNMREAAYIGEHLVLNDTRVILEPRTFSKILDALDIDSDEVVLDIGCGLGYSTAVIARLADAVVAVEDNAEMAEEAQSTLSSNGVDNAAVIAGVLSEGAAKHGPYDVIMLQGAVEYVPDAILDQLKEGGRIGCIFAEAALGLARIGYKIDGVVSWRFAFNATAPVLDGFKRPEAFTL